MAMLSASRQAGGGGDSAAVPPPAPEPISEHRVGAVVLVDIVLGDHVGRRQVELREVGRQLALERLQADIDRGAGDEIRVVQAGGAVLAFLDQCERFLLAVGGGDATARRRSCRPLRAPCMAPSTIESFSPSTTLTSGWATSRSSIAFRPPSWRPAAPALADHFEAGLAVVDELAFDQAAEARRDGGRGRLHCPCRRRAG